MKILLIGSDSNYAIERPYLRYMAEHKDVKGIVLFAAQNRFLSYYSSSILNKILYRTGLSQILKKINHELLDFAKEFKPDIALVFKGMEVLPKTLSALRQQGIKLVNYNPDNPFIFSGRGSGNKNITNSIHLYDLHFSYDHSVINRIKQEYHLPCLPLPFGFDVPDELYNICAAEPEIVKVCFVGAADRHRAQFILELLQQGVKIDLYGPGWNKYINHNCADIFKPVYENDLWKTLRKYRVQLNLMRPHNPDSHNMRSFEVPGIGGIMLAPDTPDHRKFFVENEEIFLYKNSTDCATKINMLLNMNASDIQKIRLKVREKCVQSGYSYRDRANFVVESIKNLL